MTPEKFVTDHLVPLYERYLNGVGPDRHKGKGPVGKAIAEYEKFEAKHGIEIREECLQTLNEWCIVLEDPDSGVVAYGKHLANWVRDLGWKDRAPEAMEKQPCNLCSRDRVFNGLCLSHLLENKDRDRWIKKQTKSGRELYNAVLDHHNDGDENGEELHDEEDGDLSEEDRMDSGQD